MKGIIFHLVEQVVRSEHGEDTWDALLDAAKASGVYTRLGTYDDEELGRIVEAAAGALALPAGGVLHWVGVRAFPHLGAAHPQMLEGFEATAPLLVGLNRIIHTEVRKLYPDAQTPHFEFSEVAPSVLEMTYHSPRGLCHLAAGLAEGAAAHFGETLVTEHLRCRHRGDAECVVRLDFNALAEAAA